MTIVTPGVEPASALLSRPPSPWLLAWSRFAAAPPPLPEAVAEHASLVLLDTIGAIAAGAQESETGALAARLVAREGAGEVPAIGLAQRLRPGSAALLNGTAGTMLELDEGNQYCRGHPAIHVVPALLAAGQGVRASGAALLRALALGYDIGARVGIASKLRVTMHPHGTWGTLGAAVAVGALHGADAATVARLINVASSLGLTTSRRTMLEGGTVRNVYAGVSNQLGLLAWDLVESGFEGERDGVATVFNDVAASDFTAEAMTEALGERWEIARNYFKRHAACRYTHGALDAMAAILVQAGGCIAPDQVRAIEVDTYVWAAQLDAAEPANMLAAKFSVPFALATFVEHGAATVPAFRAPARDDPVVRELARRVTVREDPALTAMLPGLRPARLRVTLVDGRVFTAEALTNRGDIEDPYTPAEVREKFRELAGPVWGAAHAAAIEEAVLGRCDAVILAGLLGR